MQVVEDDSMSIVWHGYLSKKTSHGMVKLWQRRYFRLLGDVFEYYKTEKLGQVSGMIPITMIHSIVKHGKDKKNGCRFDLILKNTGMGSGNHGGTPGKPGTNNSGTGKEKQSASSTTHSKFSLLAPTADVAEKLVRSLHNMLHTQHVASRDENNATNNTLRMNASSHIDMSGQFWKRVDEIDRRRTVAGGTLTKAQFASFTEMMAHANNLNTASSGGTVRMASRKPTSMIEPATFVGSSGDQPTAEDLDDLKIADDTLDSGDLRILTELTSTLPLGQLYLLRDTRSHTPYYMHALNKSDIANAMCGGSSTSVASAAAGAIDYSNEPHTPILGHQPPSVTASHHPTLSIVVNDTSIISSSPILLSSTRALEKLREIWSEILQLQHPNILRALHIGESSDRIWMIYSYPIYSPLEFHIAAHVKKREEEQEEKEVMYGIPPVLPSATPAPPQQLFSTSTVLSITTQLVNLLNYLHASKIICRNLDTRHLYFNEQGQVVLCDFMLVEKRYAKEMSGGSLKKELKKEGYDSPESLRGEQEDEQSDFWRLGLIVYELLTGTLPPGFTREKDADEENEEKTPTPNPNEDKLPSTPKLIHQSSSTSSANFPGNNTSERLRNNILSFNPYSSAQLPFPIGTSQHMISFLQACLQPAKIKRIGYSLRTASSSGSRPSSSGGSTGAGQQVRPSTSSSPPIASVQTHELFSHVNWMDHLSLERVSDGIFTEMLYSSMNHPFLSSMVYAHQQKEYKLAVNIKSARHIRREDRIGEITSLSSSSRITRYYIKVILENRTLKTELCGYKNITNSEWLWNTSMVFKINDSILDTEFIARIMAHDEESFHDATIGSVVLTLRQIYGMCMSMSSLNESVNKASVPPSMHRHNSLGVHSPPAGAVNSRPSSPGQAYHALAGAASAPIGSLPMTPASSNSSQNTSSSTMNPTSTATAASTEPTFSTWFSALDHSGFTVGELHLTFSLTPVRPGIGGLGGAGGGNVISQQSPQQQQSTPYLPPLINTAKRFSQLFSSAFSSDSIRSALNTLPNPQTLAEINARQMILEDEADGGGGGNTEDDEPDDPEMKAAADEQQQQQQQHHHHHHHASLDGGDDGDGTGNGGNGGTGGGGRDTRTGAEDEYDDDSSLPLSMRRRYSTASSSNFIARRVSNQSLQSSIGTTIPTIRSKATRTLLAVPGVDDDDEDEEEDQPLTPNTPQSANAVLTPTGIKRSPTHQRTKSSLADRRPSVGISIPRPGSGGQASSGTTLGGVAEPRTPRTPRTPRGTAISSLAVGGGSSASSSNTTSASDARPSRVDRRTSLASGGTPTQHARRKSAYFNPAGMGGSPLGSSTTNLAAAGGSTGSGMSGGINSPPPSASHPRSGSFSNDDRPPLNSSPQNQVTGGGAVSGFIRGLVSKKKVRFQERGFDLDLSYIGPRLIAMGFPSEGKEAAFRNPLPQVQAFFKTFHPHNATLQCGTYKVYNLCSERKYDHSKFETCEMGQVAEYPFPDHNPPRFAQIIECCIDLHQWLSLRQENVAALHCKAGKGRTGLMISAYLLFSGACSHPDAALNYFAIHRTSNNKGVTIPSQLRYVHYFHKYLNNYYDLNRPFNWIGVPMTLTHIRLTGIPKYDLVTGGSDPYFTISQGERLIYDFQVAKLTEGGMMSRSGLSGGLISSSNSNSITNTIIAGSTGSDDNPTEHGGSSRRDIYDYIDFKLFLKVQGDCKFSLYEKDRLGRTNKVGWFWFHTSFLQESMHNRSYLKLERYELDNIVKDKEFKHFPQSFKVECWFTPLDDLGEKEEELVDEMDAPERITPAAACVNTYVKQAYAEWQATQNERAALFQPEA